MIKENLPSDTSIIELKEFEYVRPLGVYNRHFAGHPDDYFPVTWWDITGSVLLLIMYIGGTLGIMIAYCYWVFAAGVANFAMVWSLVAVAFVALVIILIYVGVRNKIKIERQLIQEKLRIERQKLKQGK